MIRQVLETKAVCIGHSIEYPKYTDRMTYLKEPTMSLKQLLIHSLYGYICKVGVAGQHGTMLHT